MQNEELKNIKRERIIFMFYELEKYKVDTEEILSFLEYQFCIKRDWLLRIIKDFDNKKQPPAHADVDAATVSAFVKKLYKQAKT